ncbi:hypothetical protein Tco_0531817 [Tanacetum coccineum]
MIITTTIVTPHKRYNSHQHNRTVRQETFKAYAATPTENNGYTGNRPLCKKCTMHHTGPCTVKCNTCNKVGICTKAKTGKESTYLLSVTAML